MQRTAKPLDAKFEYLAFAFKKNDYAQDCHIIQMILRPKKNLLLSSSSACFFLLCCFFKGKPDSNLRHSDATLPTRPPPPPPATHGDHCLTRQHSGTMANLNRKIILRIHLYLSKKNHQNDLFSREKI